MKLFITQLANPVSVCLNNKPVFHGPILLFEQEYSRDGCLGQEAALLWDITEMTVWSMKKEIYGYLFDLVRNNITLTIGEQA